MDCARLNRIAKDVYPISELMRHEIFKHDVTATALQRYLNVDSYVATAIIYRLEAGGYVSKPLVDYDYKRKLLR